MNHIAIFSSGAGTNAENLIRYFQADPAAQVSLLLCNRPGAGVITRAGNLHIPVKLFDRKEFYSSDEIPLTLERFHIDLIVLAGFLWLVPDPILDAYEDRILNIHPALLPDFGGKGMYGHRVHEAVIQSGRKESGITVHLVNREYDRGRILFQARCRVEPNDTPDSLASRIHKLEYDHFPRVVKEFLTQLSAG